jgi:glycosyltransferase involved in cell wall biosynthesis
VKIGLNLLFRVPTAGGGVETYVRRLVNEIIRLDDTNEYVIFFSGAAGMFPVAERRNVTFIACNVDSNNRAHRYVWEQTALPLQVIAHRLRILHSMNYVSPVACPCKAIVTFQDVSYREPAVEMSLKRRMGLNVFSALSARSSDAVVTVSEFSKRSICSSLGISGDKIRVVPSGPGWNSGPPLNSQIEAVLRKYCIVKPYVIAFAGGYAHKNVPRLLTAFETACGRLPHRLVLIGRLSENVEIAPPYICDEFKERIQALGVIETADIYPILAGSDLFVFPSLYEGFGLPLLEAQEAGVAVACSNVASIPEVAGEGAAYFDPRSVESISVTIRNCLSDTARRAGLVQLGFKNVRRFSWEAAAKSHIELYSELGA